MTATTKTVKNTTPEISDVLPIGHVRCMVLRNAGGKIATGLHDEDKKYTFYPALVEFVIAKEIGLALERKGLVTITEGLAEGE
jgi:hypothetical protein